MKHLKTYEKKNLKDYNKYTDVALEFIKELTQVEKVRIYKEDDELILSIKTWNNVSKAFFDEMEKYIGTPYYKIFPNSGAQLTVEYYGIDTKFLSLLDQIIERNKFNL